MRITIATLLAGITILLAACKKQDYCDNPPKNENCDLVQAVLNRPATPDPEEEFNTPGTFSAFRKEYDGTTGKVRKVVAGLFTFYLYDSISMLVRHSGSSVYFLRETAPDDTIAIATFDGANRLQQIEALQIAQLPFETTQFTYTSNRLAGYTIGGNITVKLSYDAAGNIVHMYNPGDTATGLGRFFTYDLWVTATRQWYFDDFELGSEEAVRLAQFMGWLPDLEPVNRRISYKDLVDYDEDGVPEVFTSRTLSNHLYDSDGKLISYKSDGETYTNIWSCSKKTNTSPN